MATTVFRLNDCNLNGGLVAKAKQIVRNLWTAFNQASSHCSQTCTLNTLHLLGAVGAAYVPDLPAVLAAATANYLKYFPTLTFSKLIEMTNIRENTCAESLHETVQRGDPILSDEARRVLEIIFNSALGGLIGVLGSVANVINIIVFVKQGFRDSVGVKLCALAVSDLGFLLTMIMFSISSNHLVQNVDNGIIANLYRTATGALKNCFVITTNGITAFITFERCVCVALPLKVKTIITPKKTITSIFVIFLATIVMSFSHIGIPSTCKSKQNTTIIQISSTSQSFSNVSYFLSAFTQISSFIIISICAVVLVLRLHSKLQWRYNSVALSDVLDAISARDQKAMKLVITISTTFVACYSPCVVNLILMAFLSPEYGFTGFYENSFIASWSIIFWVNGLNSSVTILIYYNMSSTFRATFKGIFFTPSESNINLCESR